MHHGEALDRETGDATLAEAVVSGRFDELEPRRRAMCRYALTLTLAPASVDESDLEPLRRAGLDDRSIVDVNQVVSYFNYVNRIADGLGVELEARWPEAARLPRRYPLANSPGRIPSVRAEELPWISTEQMREIDRIMVEDLGIDLPKMMENAGRSLAILARVMLGGFLRGRNVVVLVGPGGNGGGGLVAARHLVNAGAAVRVALGTPRERMAAVTAEQAAIASRLGIPVSPAPPERTPCDLVIDALLGYGQRGAPRAGIADLIVWSRGRRVLALDVPSGLELASGVLHEPHVTAEATLTLAAPRRGLREIPAPVGTLFLGDVSVPPVVLHRVVGVSAWPFHAGPILRVG